MSGVVTFDITAFRAAYPNFSTVTDDQLTAFFNVAEMILDNTTASRVSDTDERRILLWMLVCHLATLSLRGNAAVGAISSASEGSVSTSFAQLPITNASWWYLQTPCGATYWQATAKYRQGGRYFVYHYH